MRALRREIVRDGSESAGGAIIRPAWPRPLAEIPRTERLQLRLELTAEADRGPVVGLSSWWKNEGGDWRPGFSMVAVRLDELSTVLETLCEVLEETNS